MAGPKIGDRSAVEIVIDDRWGDVGLPRHGRRISELLRNSSHDSGDGPLLLGFGLGESA